MSALLMMSDKESMYGKASVIAFLNSAVTNVILIPIYVLRALQWQLWPLPAC